VESLGNTFPVDINGSLPPLAHYTWSAPADGDYQVSATGSYAVTLDVRFGDCYGTALPTLVAVAAGNELDITVSSTAGGAGPFELRIDRVTDVCGDGLCESSETTASCPQDCTPPPPPPVCGDNVCSAGEDCSSCPQDCGTCSSLSTCGDGVCDPDEDCNSCPQDCGACSSPTPTCGDGVCDTGEDCNSCPEDCGTCPTDPWCDPTVDVC
jgi:hypothetical protein